MGSASRTRPRLAVTLGDPRGVGPEITAAALRDSEVESLAEFVVIGPTGTAAEAQDIVGTFPAGGTEAVAGRLAGLAIDRAIHLATSGAVDGVVTAPIDKHALLAGGYDFPGHTEMLGARTGTRPVMMLAGTPPGSRYPLRVVLATTHIALRDVPSELTEDRIVHTARVTRAELIRLFGIARPRLALCAMNPHAGDGGRFGDEEARVLAPAAKRAGAEGPFPADTVFVRAMRGEFDAVIAPYHDVGMTAIKVAAFGSAINITLGLPFPRTSPDHGTALDIAGKGIADPGSMIAAIKMCAALATASG